MVENLVVIFFVALGSTFIASLVILATQSWHGHWTYDHVSGIQKFHENPTPRVGGLAIVAGLLGAVFLGFNPTGWEVLKPIIVAGMIPFFFGFGEDLTKKVSVRDRLLATMAGGVVYISMTGISLIKIDIPYVDDLLTFRLVAICLTVISVAGMTNAINILDGFNGLASGVALIQFFCLVMIANFHGDADLVYCGLIFMGVLAGFMLLNYPFGKIFLGDAGAYLIGFSLSWFAILLPLRHEDISPWASLLVCAYPVIEAIYSIYRRMVFSVNPGRPDNLHMHSLIKTRLIRRYFYHMPTWFKNALVAPIIWSVTLFFGIYAVYFSARVEILMLGFFFFLIGYHLIYRELVQLPEF